MKDFEADGEEKVIANKAYFMAIVISMSISQCLSALTSLQIAPISAQIKEAFGWTDQNFNIYLSMTQTAPFLAGAFANFLGYKFSKYSPSKVVFINKLFFLGSLSLTLVTNTPLLICARFVMGISLGLQFPPVTSILYEATP